MASGAENFGKFMDSFEEFQRDNKVQGQIQFPIEISDIEWRGTAIGRATDKVGSWVSIRPCGDTKTHLGVYLGDLPLDSMYSYNVKSKMLSLIPHCNPAIYVPDLKRVVWGCESWWGIIDSPAKLRQISDADIQNVWYVKALKELSEAPTGQ